MSEIMLYLISNTFSVYIYSRFIKIFLKECRVSNGILILSYCLYYIINSLVFLKFHNPYLNLLTTLVPLGFITFEYKAKTSLRISSTILMVVTVGSIDSIIVTLFGKNSIVVSNGFITGLVCFLLELLIENMIIPKNIYDIKLLHLISLLVVPGGSITILVLNKNQDSMFVIIQSSILLVINFMVFFFYDLIMKTYEEKIKLQAMEQKNKEYVHQIELNNTIQEQVRYLRHDMNNHLQHIEILLKQEDYSGVYEYLNICKESNSCNGLYSNCGNIDIDSLLNYKLSKIDKEVTVETNISIPKDISVNSFDLTVILGNLLDNSIEALEKCQNKYLSINLTYDKGVLFIDIKNSYTGKLKILNDTIKTSKQDKKHHGLGIQSVRHTLKKYNGTINFLYDKNIFQVKVMLFDLV